MLRKYIQLLNQDQLDFELAKENWQNFRLRNKSIIVDNMYGQYKSKLVCPTCKSVSLTFDPFLLVQLTIHQVTDKSFSYKAILSKDLSLAINREFSFSKKQNLTIQEFKEMISKELNCDSSSLITYSSTQYSNSQIFSDSQNLNECRKKTKLSNSFVIRLLTPAEQQIQFTDRIAICITHNDYSGSYGSKRVLSNNNFYYFSTRWSLRGIHEYIFYLICHLFEEKFGNDLESKDFYENEIYKKYYKLMFKSNANYWNECYLCGQKGCQDCQIPLQDDKKVNDILNNSVSSTMSSSSSSSTQQLEIYLVWKKCPIDRQSLDKLFNQQNDDTSNDKPKNQSMTLQECLKESQKAEQLGEDNAWYCRKCQDHVKAFKSMQLYKTPKILIFSFKRFKSSNKYFKSKLETLIEFPVDGFQMDDFVLNTNLPQLYEEETLQENGEKKQTSAIYDLYGIVNHFGGMGGGHYTAYAKNYKTNKWYEFDDSIVKEIENEKQLIGKAAYVLFYQKRGTSENITK